MHARLGLIRAAPRVASDPVSASHQKVEARLLYPLVNSGDSHSDVLASVPHANPTSDEAGFQNEATSPSASSLRGSPLTSGGTGEGQGPLRTDALQFPTGYVSAAPSAITPSRSPPCDGVTVGWAVPTRSPRQRLKKESSSAWGAPTLMPTAHIAQTRRCGGSQLLLKCGLNIGFDFS